MEAFLNTDNENNARVWTRKDIAAKAGVSTDLLRHYERKLANFLSPKRVSGRALHYSEADAQLILEAVSLKMRRGFSMKQLFQHFNASSTDSGVRPENSSPTDQLSKTLERLESIESMSQATDHKVEVLADAASKLLAQNQALFGLVRDMHAVMEGLGTQVAQVNQRFAKEDQLKSEVRSLSWFGKLKLRLLGPAQESSEAVPAPTSEKVAVSTLPALACLPSPTSPSSTSPSPASPRPGFAKYFQRFADDDRRLKGDPSWFIDYLGPVSGLGRRGEGSSAA